MHPQIPMLFVCSEANQLKQIFCKIFFFWEFEIFVTFFLMFLNIFKIIILFLIISHVHVIILQALKKQVKMTKNTPFKCFIFCF